MQSVQIYGCDIGTSNASIAYIEDGKAYSYFTCFDAGQSAFHIHSHLEDFVKGISPLPHSRVFIEGVFKGPNQRTYARMVRVAHSLDIIFSDLGCSVEHIMASSWRSILLGTSRIAKVDAQKWIMERYPFLKSYPKSEISHRSDSLCIALAGGIKTGAIVT